MNHLENFCRSKYLGGVRRISTTVSRKFSPRTSTASSTANTLIHLRAISLSPKERRGYGGAPVAMGTPVVEITDVTGQVLLLNVLTSGNFSTQRNLTPPYRARALFNGMERVMSTPQTSGDCNLCHTQAGTMDAPGRIIFP
jgi:hypothetical protein